MIHLYEVVTVVDSAFTNPEVEAGLFQALADFDPDTLVAQAENAMSSVGLRLKCKCLSVRAVLAEVRPNVGQMLERLTFEFVKLVKFLKIYERYVTKRKTDAKCWPNLANADMRVLFGKKLFRTYCQILK